MFRFIELLGVVILLWFIANFVNYIMYKLTGYTTEGNWWLGLSNNWIKQEQKNKRG